MVFAAVKQQGYGVLAAMLSSFGTAAGTIGTAIAVALMELDAGQGLWSKAAAFAGAQQFAFACLASIGLVTLIIALMNRRGDQPAVTQRLDVYQAAEKVMIG